MIITLFTLWLMCKLYTDTSYEDEDEDKDEDEDNDDDDN